MNNGYTDGIGGPPGGVAGPPGSLGTGVLAVALPGLIQAGANLYDSAQNRKAAAENTDKTIAANKAEAELAYQRSVEMWNMQNAYNTPQAQMERFKSAGLNPHLIYGQGNSGNASAPPNYQPADMQHRYISGNFGQSIATLLPTLMSVGTWLQNMRLSEVDIQKRSTETERAQQMIDFLTERNPQLLKEKENLLSLFPYQESIKQFEGSKASVVLADMMEEFNYKWGQALKDTPFHTYTGVGARSGSAKDVELKRKILENVIKGYESKLKEAQASWTDYGLTNPQAIMQMVVSGVMGMAGIQMRAGKSVPKVNQKLSRTITNYERGGRRVVKRNFYE